MSVARAGEIETAAFDCVVLKELSQVLEKMRGGLSRGRSKEIPVVRLHGSRLAVGSARGPPVVGYF